MRRSGILCALVFALTPSWSAVARADAAPETLPPAEGAPRDDAATAAPRSPPDARTFQRELSPHGEWVDSPRYGRVWRPRVPAGWRPYYYGRWVWTANGWFWASDEPWGWATYHYGRWGYDDVLGWVWVPGYEWAPAWVTWRFGVGVVGWAPLFPGFSIFATVQPTFFFAFTFVPAVRFVNFPVFRVAFAPVFAQRFFFATRPVPPRTVFRGAWTPRWGGPPHRLVQPGLGRSFAHARSAPGHGFHGGGPFLARRPEGGFRGGHGMPMGGGHGMSMGRGPIGGMHFRR